MASSRSDAQSLRLPRNVCVSVCASRKAHRHQLKERKREWRRTRRKRGGSLAYSSLPRKRAAATQMSQNPYADERAEKWISGRIFWRTDSARLRLKKLCVLWDGMGDYSHAQTGHGLAKQRGQRSKVQWVGRQANKPASRSRMQTRNTFQVDLKERRETAMKQLSSHISTFTHKPPPSPWLHFEHRQGPVGTLNIAD